MTLREIAAGKVTFENIKDLPDQLGETGNEGSVVGRASAILP
jgi:hypothetical protein